MSLKGPYSAGSLALVTGGRNVSEAAAPNSCPVGWKIFAPQSEVDWATVCASDPSLCDGRRLLVDVTKPTSSTPCRARVYESPGDTCNSAAACEPWGAGTNAKCCGATNGFCSSGATDTGDYVSENDAAWLNLDKCQKADFIRVSEGCSIEVATDNNGAGSRQTYTGDAPLNVERIGYDKARSIRLSRSRPAMQSGAVPGWTTSDGAPWWLSNTGEPSGGYSAGCFLDVNIKGAPAHLPVCPSVRLPVPLSVLLSLPLSP